MDALKSFGWFRTATARHAAQQDPAEMGTAFGLDACFAASPPEVDTLVSVPGASRPDTARASAAGTPSTGFWRRFSGRRAPGR